MIFCLLHFRGDEKVKSFIWDLITPAENGQALAERNLASVPVHQQRGSRKNKKETASTSVLSKKGGEVAAVMAPEPKVALFEGAEWTKDEKYNPEINLDSGFRRHITRHCNKVLLRIRMLHYIKQEIIRDLEAQVNAGVNAATLPIQPPSCEKSPTPWWDAQADVSLLVGTYKHGYEQYDSMRLDPTLCFLARFGSLDKQEPLSEMASLEANGDELDKAQSISKNEGILD